MLALGLSSPQSPKVSPVKIYLLRMWIQSCHHLLHPFPYLCLQLRLTLAHRKSQSCISLAVLNSFLLHCYLTHYAHLFLCWFLPCECVSCPILCNPKYCTLTGSSVHGILQVRILECVAFPFSRGSSQLRDWTRVACIAGRFFTPWATRDSSSEVFCYWTPTTANQVAQR